LEVNAATVRTTGSFADYLHFRMELNAPFRPHPRLQKFN
jgi:hypothetical protein